MNAKSILLVEDNKDDELLTLRAFKKNGISNDVVVARDGVEALDYLLGSGESEAGPVNALPRVVLLDLNLPRLSGLEVLKRIRADERTKLIAVVILTSSKESDDIVAGYSYGANAYVRKPVDFSQFTEAVKTLGLFWLSMNEIPHDTPRR